MALNNNLNGVLNNVVHDIAPVIKHSNGLYTVVNKSSIAPSEVNGTNLICRYYITGSIADNEVILLGTWGTEYNYDSVTNTWTRKSSGK